MTHNSQFGSSALVNIVSYAKNHKQNNVQKQRVSSR